MQIERETNHWEEKEISTDIRKYGCVGNTTMIIATETEILYYPFNYFIIN